MLQSSEFLSIAISWISFLFSRNGPVERWQILITGGLAIVAALIGGRYINKQIIASERQEKSRRESEFNAALAVMPLALSELAFYALVCGQALGEIYAQRDGADI